MPILRTIAVYHPDGKNRIVINERDFDPAVHRRWGEPSTPPPPPPPPVSRPVVNPVIERRKELEAMDWREIKAIGEDFIPPITKAVIAAAQDPPANEDDVRWDMAIPLIIDREYPA